MSLGPGSVLMFLLSGGLAIWGFALLPELGNADGYGIVILGMVVLGIAGCVLSLLPLRDGDEAKLRRIQQWQSKGLLSDEEAEVARRRILG